MGVTEAVSRRAREVNETALVRYEGGESVDAIAIDFGVSRNRIHERIRAGRRQRRKAAHTPEAAQDILDGAALRRLREFARTHRTGEIEMYSPDDCCVLFQCVIGGGATHEATGTTVAEAADGLRKMLEAEEP